MDIFVVVVKLFESGTYLPVGTLLVGVVNNAEGFFLANSTRYLPASGDTTSGSSQQCCRIFPG